MNDWKSKPPRAKSKLPRITSTPQLTLGKYRFPYRNIDVGVMLGLNRTQAAANVIAGVLNPAPDKQGFLPPDLIRDSYNYTENEDGSLSLLYKSGRLYRRNRQPATPYLIWFCWVASSWVNGSWAASYSGFVDFMDRQPEKFSFDYYQSKHRDWVELLAEERRVVIEDEPPVEAAAHEALVSPGVS